MKKVDYLPKIVVSEKYDVKENAAIVWGEIFFFFFSGLAHLFIFSFVD